MNAPTLNELISVGAIQRKPRDLASALKRRRKTYRERARQRRDVADSTIGNAIRYVPLEEARSQNLSVPASLRSAMLANGEARITRDTARSADRQIVLRRHYVILVDCSGSMDAAIAVAAQIVEGIAREGIQRRDRVTLIGFGLPDDSGRGDRITVAHDATRDITGIRQTLSEWRAYGFTPLCKALRKTARIASALVAQHKRGKAEPVFVLASDLIASDGYASEVAEELRALAETEIRGIVLVPDPALIAGAGSDHLRNVQNAIDLCEESTREAGNAFALRYVGHADAGDILSAASAVKFVIA